MVISKAEIIKSTLNLIQIHGWEKLSVRLIAKEIGFSTIKIYSDFGSKEELLFEIQKIGFSKLIKSYKNIIKRSTSSSEALEKIAISHINFSKKFHIHYELMFSFKFNKCNEEAISIKQQIQSIIFDIITNLGAKEPKIAMHQYCAMLYGYVRISQEMTDANDEFIENSVKQFIRIFENGVK